MRKRQRTRTRQGAHGEVITSAHVVDALESLGCVFKWTPGGSLVVANLGNAPLPLRELFFESDGAQVVAYIRSRQKTALLAA